MSDNSLLASQAFPVSGIETAGAIARLSGDAVHVPAAHETALVQKGGKSKKNRQYKKGGKNRKSSKGGKKRKLSKSRKSRK